MFGTREFQAGSGFSVPDAARVRRRNVALGGAAAAARAAASRSSASLARRSARKRLVLAASFCRDSEFAGFGFVLLLLDCMFVNALSFVGVQHSDHSGSFVVFDIFTVLSCCRARCSHGSRTICARFTHAMPAGSCAS